MDKQDKEMKLSKSCLFAVKYYWIIRLPASRVESQEALMEK